MLAAKRDVTEHRMPDDSISNLERYKRVCSQIDRFADRATDSFKLFIQLSIATVGGFAWLKTQDHPDNIKSLLDLARWVIPTLAVITAWQLLSDLTSWWGFREKEAELLQDPTVKPKCLNSGRLEFFRIAVLAVAAWAAFNWLR
jgi:hypothetical protein